MAKLKPSEFRLMLIFGILAFALGNVYGYKLLTNRHNEVKNKREDLRARLTQAENLALQEEDSFRKQEWLAKRVPVYPNEDHMKTFLLKFVRQKAAAFGLNPEPQPQEPELVDGYMRSKLEVSDVSGSIDTIIQFIFSLQDPEEFRAITSLELKAKPKDPTVVFCELVIEQWWNPDSLSIAASSNIAPAESGVGVQPPANPATESGATGVVPGGPNLPTASVDVPSPAGNEPVPAPASVPVAPREDSKKRVVLPKTEKPPGTNDST